MIKVLLYCEKAKPYAKPYLYKYFAVADNPADDGYTYDTSYSSEEFKNEDPSILNGTIPCECEVEAEEIYYGCDVDDFWTETCGSQKDIKHNLLIQSCLEHEEIYERLQPRDSYYGNCGYALHIKNLHVFDNPKSLNDFYSIHNVGGMLLTDKLERAPRNIQVISLNEWDYGTYCPSDVAILLPVHPDLLCKVLCGECTIIIKKRILKGMVNKVYRNDW